MPKPSPYPSRYPSTYPSDDEWWDKQHANVSIAERKALISNASTSRWSTGSVMCCFAIIILIAVAPTAVIAAVLARIGFKVEQQATPFAEKALPMINDAQDVVRTASMTTRLVHSILNESVMHNGGRIPATFDMTIGTLNQTKRLINRLANMAEHPPAVTLNMGG